MSIIASEANKESPIIVAGNGQRLRVYCLFDEAAILGDGASEDPLAWSPTDGDWWLSFPCASEDLNWVQRELALASPRFSARDMSGAAPNEGEQSSAGASADLGPINVKAFMRP